MKKLFLAVFILLDIAVMAAAGLVLYAHLNQRPLPFGAAIGGAPLSTAAASATPLVETPAASSSSASVGATTPAAGNSLLAPSPMASSAMAGLRHIGFTYRNSHARKVDLKADFTQWKSEPMTNKNGVWTYLATLPPGEYEYCFIVDDNKGIRDPTNKRIKQIGTTYVSAIVVTPLSAKPK